MDKFAIRTLIVYVVLGPLAGGLALSIYSIGSRLASALFGNPDDFVLVKVALMELPFSLLSGYFFGFFPALMCAALIIVMSRLNLIRRTMSLARRVALVGGAGAVSAPLYFLAGGTAIDFGLIVLAALGFVASLVVYPLAVGRVPHAAA